MQVAYLSLGSNLGDRAVQIERAIELLAATPSITVVRRSSLFETEPRDFLDQPWFLNAVVEIETGLDPYALLDRTRDIEDRLGRIRIADKGPRTVDIDILLFGDVLVSGPDLQIPHPRMSERRFVLEPLREIAPGLRHPGTGKTVEAMLARVQDQAVCKFAS